MQRNGAGEVFDADDRHAVVVDHLAGLCQFAIAAALGGEVDDHAAKFHLIHRVGGDEFGSRFAGHERRGDDDVAVGDHLCHQRSLPDESFLGLGFGVATFVLGVGGVEWKLDESRADRLHLLLDRRANVVSAYDGAHAFGGRDGLQPRHAGADDEHLRRLNRAGGGHEHRENPR